VVDQAETPREKLNIFREFPIFNEKRSFKFLLQKIIQAKAPFGLNTPMDVDRNYYVNLRFPAQT